MLHKVLKENTSMAQRQWHHLQAKNNNHDQLEQGVWRIFDQWECFTLGPVEEGLEHPPPGWFQLVEGRPVRVPGVHRGSRGRDVVSSSEPSVWPLAAEMQELYWSWTNSELWARFADWSTQSDWIVFLFPSLCSRQWETTLSWYSPDTVPTSTSSTSGPAPA